MNNDAFVLKQYEEIILKIPQSHHVCYSLYTVTFQVSLWLQETFLSCSKEIATWKIKEEYAICDSTKVACSGSQIPMKPSQPTW